MVSVLLRGCDGPESLLPGCVPDLQLDSLPINIHCADLKVDADGGDVAAWRRREDVKKEYDRQKRIHRGSGLYHTGKIRHSTKGEAEHFTVYYWMGQLLWSGDVFIACVN